MYGVYGSRREKPQAGGRILGSNTRGDSPRLDDLRVSLAVGGAIVLISSPGCRTAVRVGLAVCAGFQEGAADYCVFRADNMILLTRATIEMIHCSQNVSLGLNRLFYPFTT